jgi:hypothetical protein
MPGIIRKILPITPSIINTISTDLLFLGLNKDIIMPMNDMAATHNPSTPVRPIINNDIC